MFTGPQGIALQLPRSLKAAALAASLVLSALLTVLALRTPDYHWLAWISFLPLFVAVRCLGCPVPSRTRGMVKDRRQDGYDQPVMRPGDPWPWATCDGGLHGQAGSLWSRTIPWIGHHTPWPAVRRMRRLTMPPGRPSIAVLAGALWGGSLYLFYTAGPTPSVDTLSPAVGLTGSPITPSACLLALLIVIPAVYVGLAARPARAIGFQLLTLALGWTLIEVVLVTTYTNTPEPRASARAVLQNQDYSDTLQQGLLTASQSEAQHLHWLARLLGYVSTAFLVACATASLVTILSGARPSFPACRSLAGSPNTVGWVSSQVVSAIQSWSLRQAHPRAPPIQVANPSWNPVGNAH